jgi:hypothetical protein
MKEAFVSPRDFGKNIYKTIKPSAAITYGYTNKISFKI